jgi:O-methyltransferase/aklanonic acid methyltransferase
MATADYKIEVTRAFHAAADHYDGGEVSFFSPMGRSLVELAGPRRGDRVLDIGCGRGACVFAAAEAVGPAGAVVGIDIAAAMIERVNGEARALNLPQVSATVMDAEHPDFAECSFDVVVGSFSVIYLGDGPAALHRYAPLLAPGGRFAFTTPVFDDEHIPFLPHLFTEIITDDVLDEVPPQWRPRQFHERLTGWLANPGVIEAKLVDAGFEVPWTTVERMPMVTCSGADWVAWSRTHGMRLLWDRLGERGRARLEKKITDRLDALRGADGFITLDLPVRFVVARKPGDLT